MRTFTILTIALTMLFGSAWTIAQDTGSNTDSNHQRTIDEDARMRATQESILAALGQQKQETIAMLQHLEKSLMEQQVKLVQLDAEAEAIRDDAHEASVSPDNHATASQLLETHLLEVELLHIELESRRQAIQNTIVKAKDIKPKRTKAEEIAIEQAMIRAEMAQMNTARLQKLIENGAVTVDEARIAESEFKIARLEVERLKAQAESRVHQRIDAYNEELQQIIIETETKSLQKRLLRDRIAELHSARKAVDHMNRIIRDRDRAQSNVTHMQEEINQLKRHLVELKARHEIIEAEFKSQTETE